MEFKIFNAEQQFKYDNWSIKEHQNLLNKYPKLMNFGISFKNKSSTIVIDKVNDIIELSNCCGSLIIDDNSIIIYDDYME